MATREPMLDMFIFETNEMIDQLQQIMMESEKKSEISPPAINEIFRIMHTIKGSSGMMMYDNISHLAHAVEDMFFFIRESKPENIDYSSLVDLVLESGDLIKEENDKIDADEEANTDFSEQIEKVSQYLTKLKEANGVDSGSGEVKKTSAVPKFYVGNDKENIPLNFFGALLYFEENCEMENIRSFTVLHKLKEIAEVLHFEPDDILYNNDSIEVIRNKGFKMYFKTAKAKKEVENFLDETIFLDHYDLFSFETEKELLEKLQLSNEELSMEAEAMEAIQEESTVPNSEIFMKEDFVVETPIAPQTTPKIELPKANTNTKNPLISVDVNKLDMLMDLVGELVISEALVTNNAELRGLELEDFHKAARQHRKRITDLQDVVMSIRMVSLAPTLNKMNRIVRDMCKKLNKKAELVIIGENTEVDKNIIEHIGDPLMHIIRNSMDHGIETEAGRKAAYKSLTGKITIEAKNTGGDVLITIKDDGKGLDRDKILLRAIENGIITDDGSSLSDREIYATIFSPGLSTKEEVTEFSGRGVGMDVVVKEIEKVRGNVTVDSELGEGTTVSIKIPLTIAILDGMIVRVGDSIFTIPVTSIKQSIIVKNHDVFKDLDNKEMITIRGECFSILRLHELYQIKSGVTQIEEGIVIMVEEDGKAICLFADELLGEQQVVIKALPDYISKIKGTSGCTLLGNGSISLILDVSQLVNL